MAREDHVAEFEQIMANLLSQTPNKADAPPLPVVETVIPVDTTAQNAVLSMLIEPSGEKPAESMEPEDMAGIPDPEACPVEAVKTFQHRAETCVLTLDQMKEKLARLKGGA